MGIFNMTHAKDEKGRLVVTEEVYVKSVGQRRKQGCSRVRASAKAELSNRNDMTIGFLFAANKNKGNA